MDGGRETYRDPPAITGPRKAQADMEGEYRPEAPNAAHQQLEIHSLLPTAPPSSPGTSTYNAKSHCLSGAGGCTPAWCRGPGGCRDEKDEG